MSPKISAHGGPTHAGDPVQVKAGKPFGQMLAEARAGTEEPQDAEVTTKNLDGEPVQETAPEPEPDAASTADPELKPAKRTAAPKKAAPKVVTGKATAVIGDLGARDG